MAGAAGDERRPAGGAGRPDVVRVEPSPSEELVELSGQRPLGGGADEAVDRLAALVEDQGRYGLHAVLLGAGALDLAGQAGAGGADVVHVVSHPMLTDFGPEAFGESVVQLISVATPTAVMAVGTSRGNEVIAHVAARLNLPFVANCTSVDPAGDLWSMTRIQWGGSLLEDATLDSGGGPKLLTFGHHAVAAEAPAEALRRYAAAQAKQSSTSRSPRCRR